MVVEDSTIRENGKAVREPKGVHQKRSNNSNGDFTFIVNKAFVQQNDGVVDVSENTEVDITGTTNLDRVRYGLVGARSQDSTESSSSFEESISEGDESDLYSDVTSAVAFGEGDDILSIRRKRVTSHWRAFVKPIMWRCKWVEVQLSKLKSIAQKYDKELARYSDKKQFEFVNFGSAEDLSSKTAPFPFSQRRTKCLERKRRRRNEDEMDIAEYMSKHNLFSFYENRKSAADGAFQNDDHFNSAPISTEKLKSGNELKRDEELKHLMRTDGNNSAERTLRKIGGLQSRVSTLRARLKKVMGESAAGKLTRADSRLLRLGSHSPLDALTNGLPTIATQLLAEFTRGTDAAVFPYSEVCGNGDGKTERTDQPIVVGTCVNNEEVFMIYDYKSQERMRSFPEAEFLPEAKLEMMEGRQRRQRSVIPPAVQNDQSAQGVENEGRKRSKRFSV